KGWVWRGGGRGRVRGVLRRRDDGSGACARSLRGPRAAHGKKRRRRPLPAGWSAAAARGAGARARSGRDVRRGTSGVNCFRLGWIVERRPLAKYKSRRNLPNPGDSEFDCRNFDMAAKTEQKPATSADGYDHTFKAIHDHEIPWENDDVRGMLTLPPGVQVKVLNYDPKMKRLDMKQR